MSLGKHRLNGSDFVQLEHESIYVCEVIFTAHNFSQLVGGVCVCRDVGLGSR